MLLNRFKLTDQVAIISGGGRGIGRAIALSYAEAGADVVCAARTLADVEAVAEEVRGLGRRALVEPGWPYLLLAGLIAGVVLLGLAEYFLF